MRIKRSILAPVVVALIALATGGWLLQQGVSQEKNVYFQARLFEEVLHHVSDRFVEQKDPSALYKMAIDGMLQQLGDPHSTFMTPEDYERLRVQTQGEYGGLGIQIAKRNGWITVIAPLPNTPAERAGMQSGDQIVEFEGASTQKWSEDEALAKLRGPKGTPVNLKVTRPGMEATPIPFRIVREEIQIKSVPVAYMVTPTVGFVDLTVFAEKSREEVQTAIDRLRSQGMKGLILDVRTNPGGLLDAGIGVSDMFLPRGALISETRSRVGNQNQKLSASGGDHYPGLPIVVLVNQYSASASEILAGALQDHDRALVLGQTTYGKGSVQTLFPLPNNNWLKLTTARWYTPVGRSIQKPYGIGAHEDGSDIDPEEVAEAAPGAVVDTTKKPAFKTDGGRTVYGGGGIIPDLIIPADTFSVEERAYLTAVQKYGSKYADARFTFGVRYAKAHPELKPGFAVTPDMLAEFYTLLNERGSTVERPVYNLASRWIGRELASEVTRAKWGDQEVRKRFNADDPQVRVATELLQRSTDPRSLFTVADGYQGGRNSPAAVQREAAAATPDPQKKTITPR
jgi:carboxyl-terminal processing protease